MLVDKSFWHRPERYLLGSYDKPLYFETIDEAIKCVSDIIGHPFESTTDAIKQILDNYRELHDDNDTGYSVHEFIENREG